MNEHVKLLNQLAEEFAGLCKQDDRVAAAFLGGSLATGTADEWSDLDLYVIVEAAEYDTFFKQRKQFIQQWEKAAFLEDFNEFGFDMLVFILENGVQGEIGLANDGQFTHIHGGPYRVLVDKRELLEGVEFPLTGPSRAAQMQSLSRQLNWFWRDLALLQVALGRGQKWTAYGYLESMRQRCANLMRMEADFGAWAGGYEKLEGAADQEALAVLESTVNPLEPNAIKAAAKALIAIYTPLARQLAEAHGLDYPGAAETTVLKMGEKVLGR